MKLTEYHAKCRAVYDYRAFLKRTRPSVNGELDRRLRSLPFYYQYATLEDNADRVLQHELEVLRLRFNRDGAACGFPHRLDRATTGLYVSTCTEKGFWTMKSMWAQQMVWKTYCAVVVGNFTEAKLVKLPFKKYPHWCKDNLTSVASLKDLSDNEATVQMTLTYVFPLYQWQCGTTEGPGNASDYRSSWRSIVGVEIFTLSCNRSPTQRECV